MICIPNFGNINAINYIIEELCCHFYTFSSRLLVPPNTIFVTDHTTGYFVNVLPD